MPDFELFQLGEDYSLAKDIPLIIQEYARAVNRFPFTELIGIRKVEDDFLLDIEFDVERPQSPPVEILNHERIGILVYQQRSRPIEVYALRKDFPQTLHQYLTPPNSPRVLCLFEEGPREVMGQLTPNMLLGRIANWLKRAAVQALHSQDQPLEPLLLTQSRILIDPELVETSQDDQTVWAVEGVSENPLVLRAKKADKNLNQAERQFTYQILSVIVPAWNSRLIEYLPYSLQALCDLFVRLNFDLVATIRSFVRKTKASNTWLRVKHCKLILVMMLPKSRTEGGEIEDQENWAFLIGGTLEDLGEKLGLYGKVDGLGIGYVLGPDDPHALDEIVVLPLKPTYRLSRELAQLFSGIEAEPHKIIAVGAGALGSQVIMNLARQGFGEWTIIDDDVLLPHNLARHALSPYFEGVNKAEALAFEVRTLLNDYSAAKAVTSNLHNYDGSETADLFTAFSNCDLALDFSASHSVSNYLTHINGPKNRITGFIGPLGHYFVLIAEGTGQVARLDDLEAQLSAAIANDEQLQDFYGTHGNVIPYAGSCRDVSIQLPQDIVALYSGIASHWVKTNLDSEEPSIHIWKWSLNSLSIEHIQARVKPIICNSINDWDVRLSEGVIEKMREARQQRLPNETGGVLLGSIHVQYKVVQIVDLIFSPPDSVEWPTMYIRGSEDLRNQIDRKSGLSGGDLRYVGEWHTHPRGHTSEPSRLDLEAHLYLTEQMAAEGLPGIILIQGEDYDPYILLDWIP